MSGDLLHKDIAFVLPYIPKIPAGGVIVVFQYANFLIEKGHHVTLYYKTDMVLRNRRKYIPNVVRKIISDIEVPFYPTWYSLKKEIVRKGLFDGKIKKEHDIVVATGIETASIVAHSKGKLYYLIQDFENWNVSDEEVLESYKYKMNNIVISKWLSDIVENVSGIKPKYVANGIDTDIFFCNNTARIKHSLVFQYRNAESKGCKYALEAISLLKEKYCDLTVTIISKEKKGKNIPSWCEYIQNASLQDVSMVNNKSQIFICTSIEEGFGLPGLEAMACGCALVSTNYKGVMEYAVDGYNALLSPVMDVNALVNNVVRLFENNDLLEVIRANGISTGKEHSLGNAAEKFERALGIDCE